jgi:hypothetical protein
MQHHIDEFGKQVTENTENNVKSINAKGNLSDHFFIRFLKDQNIVLIGGEDIKTFRTKGEEKGPSTVRLIKLITDLENGDAYFAFKSDADIDAEG